MRRLNGVSLIELLVAIAIFGIILSFVGSYFVQQTRATALSQAINEAESVARSAAEVVVQDLQLAGARAVMVDGVPDYEPVIHSTCRDTNRSGCVAAWTINSGGGIVIADPPGVPDPDGYAIWYRSSLDGTSSCRRVDIALVDGQLVRSDVPCAEPPVTVGEIRDSVFALDVEEFEIEFICGVGSSEDDVAAEPGSVDPADCYREGDDSQFVRQARVTVGIHLSRRVGAIGEMVLTATTPNLRPGINYLRDLPTEPE